MIKNDKQLYPVLMFHHAVTKNIFLENHNQPVKKIPTASEEENNSVKRHFSCYLAPSNLQDSSRPRSRLRAEASFKGLGG